MTTTKKADINYLDLDAYLDKYSKVKIGGVEYRVGQVPVETVLEVQAEAKKLQVLKDKMDKGEEVDQSQFVNGLVEQAYILLKADTPDIDKEVLRKLPFSALMRLIQWATQVMNESFLDGAPGIKSKVSPKAKAQATSESVSQSQS